MADKCHSCGAEECASSNSESNVIYPETGQVIGVSSIHYDAVTIYECDGCGNFVCGSCATNKAGWNSNFNKGLIFTNVFCPDCA